MQALARELHLSETVFVLPAASDGDARIRIFTPKTEIPFAGHPTLAPPSFSDNPSSELSISLETGAGTIRVELEREGDRVAFGQMSQPIPRVESCPSCRRAFRRPRSPWVEARGRRIRQRSSTRFCHAGGRSGRVGAQSRLCEARPPSHPRNGERVRRRGRAMEDPRVRARRRGQRRPGNGLGCRTARAAPRPPRIDPVRSAHSDRTRCGDRATIGAICMCPRRRRPRRAHRGRRERHRRGARGVRLP